MPEKNTGVILEDDIFALTSLGQNELRGSGTSLSPAELEVLILIDGKSTAGETSARARTLSRDGVFKLLSKLFHDKLIEIAKDQASSLDFVDFFQTKGAATPSAEATAKAKKEVAATTALLQEKGYTVRIARRARARTPTDLSRTLSVLVIEDEQHLANMLKHVLAAEGFEVRTAGNREEIIAALRRPPLPDLVLLDVMLPDADGFEILLKIRQHPALKAIPVMMLTAAATRDAVLKGLAGGADGYITKPFRINLLLKAVTAMLGLPEPKGAAEKEDPWEL
jgi:two-component system, OmpR family, response regulator